eukprot:5336185-Amphidinium_carterae.1
MPCTVRLCLHGGWVYINSLQDLAQISQSQLGDLYRPENVIGNDEGSGNCYAKAFHTEGPRPSGSFDTKAVPALLILVMR